MSTLTEGKPSAGDKSIGDDSQEQTAVTNSIQQRWQKLGAEARKTWLFVGGAVACLLVTGLFELASRPADIKEYGKVGQEFYPEFTDPTVATSLSVKVIDADELKPLEFSVEQADNGRWVIPSHHNYPADAADQLAETASSVIGIKRGAMVTRWSSDHTRYGVVDPETDTVGVDELEGIGKRLTFRGQDDAILASYIIGKKVEDETGQFYVRHPAEDETYIAELDISLSTKFSDWVKTDLLDISNVDVRRVVLNDYSFEERGMGLAVTSSAVTTLSRESSSDDWKMEGLDEKSQEIDKDAIRETVDAAADLEIAGVRPKQPGLTADLKLDRSKIRSQGDFDRIQGDLLARGFLLQPSKTDDEMLQLISREGEMALGTDDGLLYKLNFGRVFTGSDKELEIGLTSDGQGEKTDDDSSRGSTDQDDSEDDQEAESEDGDSEKKTSDESADDENADDEQGDSSGKPGRYVFVRVDFESTLLGDEPKPVEPEMPEELREAEKEKEQKEEGKAGESSDTEDSDSDSESESKDDKETEKESEKDELQKIRDEYDAAKQKYQDDLRELEEFEDKVKQGKEKAEDLNRRFAQWYYVIPGEDYDKLSLSRQDLIKAKEKEENEDSESAAKDDKSASETETTLNEPTSDEPSLEKTIDQPETEDGVDPTSEPAGDSNESPSEPAEEEPSKSTGNVEAIEESPGDAVDE